MSSSWAVPNVQVGLPASYIEEISIDLTQAVSDLSLKTLLTNIQLITGLTVIQLDSPVSAKAGSNLATVFNLKQDQWRPNLALWDLFLTKSGNTGLLVLEVHGR